MKKILLCMLCISSMVTSFAQVPIINSKSGLPVGNASATGITYGNGLYVTILQPGKIYTSVDAASWTRVRDVSVPAGTFSRIAFGAGVFVIVGNNGLIASSTDAVTWTVRTSGTTSYMTDVQFLQGKFYATGSNTALLSSADGITWTALTMGSGAANNNLVNITYGNGVFVIGSRNSTNSYMYAYYSATGASGSWTWVNADATSGSSINKVQFLKDKFYMFTSGTKIYTSSNGSTWTNSTPSMTVTLPNSSTQSMGSPNQIFNAVYVGTTFYFYGYSQYYGRYGAIYSSADGLNFVLAPKSAYIVCQGSVYINNIFFEYGNEGVTSSADGLIYKHMGGNYSGIASSGTGYVGVGQVGQSGVLFTSPDFNTWTDKTLSNQNELNTVVYTGTKYVAAGNKSVIESADNGATWSSIATPTDYYTVLAYGGGKLVAGGYDANTYAASIAYSANGTSWTTANTDDNYYFKMKYVNNNYFALGYSNATYLGVILQSADGITWTDITPNLPYETVYFNDVVYDGSKYHFMGMDYVDAANYIYGNFFSVSTSTINNPNSFINKGVIGSIPVGVNLGGTFGEGAFAYSNGHFVGAVNDIVTYETYILYSADGVVWTAVPTDEYSIVGGITVENTNTFRLLGSSNTNFTVSYGGTLAANDLEFAAQAVNGQSLLKWQSNNQNTQQYIVQNSTDGTNWQTIGQVSALNNNNPVQNYSYVHTAPAKGRNFYRLILENTGNSKYSDVVSVFFGGTAAKVSVYPNPVVNGKMNLKLSSAATITVFNSDGIAVITKSLPAGMHQVDVSHLTKGAYFLRAGQETLPVILQ